MDDNLIAAQKSAIVASSAVVLSEVSRENQARSTFVGVLKTFDFCFRVEHSPNYQVRNRLLYRFSELGNDHSGPCRFSDS